MKAEIIAVGTELLIGETVNTNATWLSKELAELGIDVYFHSVVGDNPGRIGDIVRTALNRSNVLVFTGGLGPTDDDLTVATLAELLETPLESDPVSEERIRNYFITRDTPMSSKNIKQALRPIGSKAILNPIGTAPGLQWDVSAKFGKPTYILAFPGVPKELYAMWPDARAFLLEKYREQGMDSPPVLVSESLKFFGIGESLLGEKLGDLMAASTPTVAPYVGRAEVRIRISAKSPTEVEARSLMEPIKHEIISRCGQYYFGENEMTLEKAVADRLIERGLQVSVAESCTGGLVSSRLTDVSGSSAYTTLNVVTYSNEQKISMLNVSPETIERYGAVSPQTALEMALGIKSLTGADIGLSLTGIAGPNGGSEEKPVGLVYIGIAGPESPSAMDYVSVKVKRILVNRNYSREDIKYWFSQYALHFLRLALDGILEDDSLLEKTERLQV